MNSGLSRQVRLSAMGCHLTVLAWIPIVLFAFAFKETFLQPIGLSISVIVSPLSPFVSLLVTFTVWFSRRRLHPFVDRQGKESLNLQLSLLLFILIGLLTCTLIAMSICGIPQRTVAGPDLQWNWALFWTVFALAAILLVGCVYLCGSIAAIFAAIRAYNGHDVSYAEIVRFLR